MWHDIPLNTRLPGALVALVVGLWLLVLAARLIGSPSTSGLLDMWRKSPWSKRLLFGFFIAASTLLGADKTPVPQALLRMIFWTPGSPWQLAAQAATAAQADAAAIAAQASADAAADAIESADIVTLSFDWHAPDRLPAHDRQNILAWTAQVVPTNIAGVLYEDHYVAFNSSASTNPAVIQIEYARNNGGMVERYSAKVVTNSYPATAVVNLQSGAHTCYWFRCEVPAAFTNCVRDWSGEALFGSPAGAETGFDLLGTLVIDDDQNVWVGATTNIVLSGVTNAFANGINVTEAPE